MLKLKKQLKKVSKTALLSLVFSLTAIIFSMGLKVVLAAWQPAGSNPPQDNAYTPLDVSVGHQVKKGFLLIDPAYNPYGEIPTINYPLEVKGAGANITSHLGVLNDLRVDNNTGQVYTFYVNSTTNQVGVGTMTPVDFSKLNIEGGALKITTGVGADNVNALEGYSSASYGVYGQSAAACSGATCYAGIHGHRASGAGLTGAGVRGDGSVGVYGWSNTGIGVYGESYSSTYAAVYAENTNAKGWAGYFEGRVYATSEVAGNKFLATTLQNSLMPYVSGMKIGDYSLTTSNSGAHAENLAFDGTTVWAANAGNYETTASQIRASDGARLQLKDIGYWPLDVTFDGTYMWISGNNTDGNTGYISKFHPGTSHDGSFNYYTIDKDAKNIIATSETDASGDTRRFIWYASTNTGKVRKLYLKEDNSLEVKCTYPASATLSNPQGMAFDGTYVWVAVKGNSQIHKIDNNCNQVQVINQTEIASPQNIIFDGTYLWVTNNTPSGNILKILASDGSMVGTYLTSTITPPTGLTSWWNGDWSDRKKIYSTGNHSAYTTDNFLKITLDTAGLVSAGKMRSDCNDLRIVYQTESSKTELGRYVIGCNTTSTTVYWKVQADIPANENIGGESDYIYNIYYNNLNASDTAPAYTNTASIDAPYTADADTQALWHFAETSGNYLDASTNSNRSSLEQVNSRTATGKFGNAPEFSPTASSGHYIAVPDSNSLDITGDITLEAWIKNDTYNPNNGDASKRQTIISKKSGNPTNYGLRTQTTTGNLVFYYYSGSSQVWTSTNSIGAVGQWHHVAVTYTFGNGASLKAYVDGVQITGSWTTGNGNNAGVANTYPVGIGGINATDKQYLDGVINETRVSKTLRTNFFHIATEVSTSLDVEEASTMNGPSPYDLAFDGTYIWVTHNNTTSLTRLRASDGQGLTSYDLGGGANNLRSIIFDGTYLWVGRSGGQQITKFYSGSGWGYPDLSAYLTLQYPSIYFQQTGSFHVSGSGKLGGSLTASGNIEAPANTWDGAGDTIRFMGESCPNGLFAKGITYNPNVTWRMPEEVSYTDKAAYSGSDYDRQGIYNGPSMALDSQGRPHIAWVNMRDSKVCSNEAKQSCVIDSDCPTGSGYCTGVFDIYYLKWNGSEWVTASGISRAQALLDPVGSNLNVSNVPATTVEGASSSLYPSLALDAQGNAHISFFETGPRYHLYYLEWNPNYNNGNGTFGAWVTVSGVKRDIALDDTDSPDLCPGTYQPGDRCNLVVDNGETPSLGLDNNGNPHIAYRNPSDADIFYRWWDSSRSAWVDVNPNDGNNDDDVNVSNTGTENSHHPRLVLDSQARPHIVWIEGGEWGMVYYRWWNQTANGGVGAWVTVSGDPSPSINNIQANINVANKMAAGDPINDQHAEAPSLALYSDNYRPALVWRDPVHVFYREWNGSNWVSASGNQDATNLKINVEDSRLNPPFNLPFNYSANPSRPEVKIYNDGSNERPYVAWTNAASTPDEVNFRRWNGTNWVTISNNFGQGVNDSDLNVSQSSTLYSLSPSLAVDPALGIVHVAWFEKAWEDTKDCADLSGHTCTSDAQCSAPYYHCAWYSWSCNKCATFDVYYNRSGKDELLCRPL